MLFTPKWPSIARENVPHTKIIWLMKTRLRPLSDRKPSFLPISAWNPNYNPRILLSKVARRNSILFIKPFANIAGASELPLTLKQFLLSQFLRAEMNH